MAQTKWDKLAETLALSLRASIVHLREVLVDDAEQSRAPVIKAMQAAARTPHSDGGSLFQRIIADIGVLQGVVAALAQTANSDEMMQLAESFVDDPKQRLPGLAEGERRVVCRMVIALTKLKALTGSELFGEAVDASLKQAIVEYSAARDEAGAKSELILLAHALERVTRPDVAAREQSLRALLDARAKFQRHLDSCDRCSPTGLVYCEEGQMLLRWEADAFNGFNQSVDLLLGEMIEVRDSDDTA